MKKLIVLFLQQFKLIGNKHMANKTTQSHEIHEILNLYLNTNKQVTWNKGWRFTNHYLEIKNSVFLLNFFIY